MAKRKVAEDSSHSAICDPPLVRKAGMVEQINALPQAEFVKTYLDREHWPRIENNDILFSYVGNLEDCDLQACFDLIERTSRHDYEPSSFGWHPKRKIREMKEKEMRYVILKDSSSSSRDSGKINGFLSFMLTHDSVPAVPVVYVYEIHLSESARGQGVGGSLMYIAEIVAARLGVDKVMLTCFKSNQKARAFYRHLGYDLDVCSPEDRKTRSKIVKADYIIMSKDMKDHSATITRRLGSHRYSVDVVNANEAEIRHEKT